MNPADRHFENGSTSSQLLNDAKARSAQAWRDLVREYSALIYDECRSNGLPPQEAADVSQEVFQTVFTLFPRFRERHRTGSFRCWLRSITRNKVREHRRKGLRQPTGIGGSQADLVFAVGDESDQPATPEWPREETAERVRQAVAAIRRDFHPRTWQAFYRTAVDQQSATEVAAELAMSASAVRKAKSRVLHRLREQFEWLSLQAD